MTGAYRRGDEKDVDEIISWKDLLSKRGRNKILRKS